MILDLFGLISLLLCGPTGSGKTTWIVELLRHHEELSTHTPKKLIWIYGVEQPDLFQKIQEIWAPRQCEFLDSFPEDLMTRLEKSSDHGSLCVFDNVMNDIQTIYMWKKSFRLFVGINVAKYFSTR